MALKRISTLQSVSTDGKNIIVKETTGAYDAGTNPGGFGTPNPVVADFSLVVIQLLYLDNSQSFLTTNDPTAFMGGSNYSINSSILPTPVDAAFKDGVLKVTSYAALTLATVAGTAGNKYITGSLSNFLSADSMVDSFSNVYVIDTTQTNTSGQIYLTSALLQTITQASPSYSAYLYAMVYAGYVCSLTNAIGAMAQTCNEDDDAMTLYDLLLKKYSADFAFAAGDYVNANKAITVGDNQLNRLIHG